MSLREIIENATKGNWEWTDYKGGAYLVGEHGLDPAVLAPRWYDTGHTAVEASALDMGFISTFDPIHVALMEDVIARSQEAEDAAHDEDMPEITDYYERVGEALWKLTTYRKENGYA